MLALAVLLGPAVSVTAQDDPSEVDRWHELRPFLRPDDVGDPSWRWRVGVYPHLNLAMGLPEGVEVAPALDLSLARSGGWSVFVGYGRAYGPEVEAELWTVGWGGVHPLEGSRPQHGFHGTYLRYRRWDERDHGVHHGLSVGTASAVGPIGLGLELGAARSERNHWLPVAQVQVTLGMPKSWHW